MTMKLNFLGRADKYEVSSMNLFVRLRALIHKNDKLLWEVNLLPISFHVEYVQSIDSVNSVI